MKVLLSSHIRPGSVLANNSTLGQGGGLQARRKWTEKVEDGITKDVLNREAAFLGPNSIKALGFLGL